MPKPIPPEIRHKIIEFDPFASSSPSIEEFCRSLKISRRSFYNIRERYQQESLAALHPHSSAPVNAHRLFDESTTRVLLAIREDLKKEGWDYGPRSIHFEGITNGKLCAPVPSVSTIARLLRAAGAVEKNPKKRPKSSMIRFQRDKAMQLWQLDAFEYRLHDDLRSKVTIYQILDDATRKDLGTWAYSLPENSADAMAAVHAAIDTYGAPHELLSDNGLAFNQLRRGTVGALETYLASKGTMPISGVPRHPETQGKNERSHRTLYRYLEAHQPQSLSEVRELITTYREHYNTRRPHQSLPGPVTPETAWQLIEHAKPRPAINPAVLVAKANAYKTRQSHKAKSDPLIRQDETPASSKQYEYEKITRNRTTAKSEHAAEEDIPIKEDTSTHQSQEDGVYEQDLPIVTISRSNPRVFFQGMRIQIPRRYTERPYYKTVTEKELAFWDAVDGELVMSFPLPIIAISLTKKFINSHNIKGAWLKDPTDNWIRHHNLAEQRFAELDESQPDN